MSKVKNPLLSLDARGSLGDAVSFTRRRGVNIVEKTPIPKDAKTSIQLAWRTMFQLCRDLWHTLSPAEKDEWERAATPRHMTGYAWYLSQCLRPNPGIYLPLQGGKMQGAIDMDGFEIEDLPAPGNDQDAATKKYVDDLVDQGEGFITIIPTSYDSIIQGTWSEQIDAANPLNMRFRNAVGAANNDKIRYKVYVAVGTYSLSFSYMKSNNYAKMTVDLAGDNVVTVDQHNVANIRGVISRTTGIDIDTAGIVNLDVWVNGKSGTGWSISFDYLSLLRTA